MVEHRRRIDKVLDPEFLVDLPEWPLEELRRRQAECLEIETEVSYVRRMTQARIDILEAELDRRASGGSVGDLIAALPEILADEGPRAPVEKSAKLPNLHDDELRSTIRELGELEHEVSQQRRELHQVIDRMEADLAARHKVGQA